MSEQVLSDKQPVTMSDPEPCSKLIWWIARLAMAQRIHVEPRVGDTVVETTHLIGLARHRLGRNSALGTLMKIEETKDSGKIYTIKNLDGKECRWLNADFEVVESAREVLPDDKPVN